MDTLTLNEDDLVGTVRVWWLQIRERRTIQVVSLTSASFFGVDAIWPAGVHPERHGEWGRAGTGTRVTWFKALGRAIVLPACPVPDVSSWLTQHRTGPVATIGWRARREKISTPVRVAADGREFLLNNRAARHLLSIGAEWILKLVEPGPMLFAFAPGKKRKLRAVLSLEETR